MTIFFSFLNSLRKGHYGLAKTYWKLGVLVKMFLLTLMVDAVKNKSIQIRLF